MKEKTIRLQILDTCFQRELPHGNPGMLFVLRGSAEVERQGEHFSLDEEGFIYLRPGDVFSVEPAAESLIGIVEFCHGIFSEYLPMGGRGIDCFSGTVDERTLGQVQGRLRKVFSYYTRQEGADAALLHARVFELLYQLRTSCRGGLRRPSQEEQDSDDLGQTIQSYLYDHYQEVITLADISAKTFYSTSYLSRFIKQKFGKNFIQYLTELRLSQAMVQVGATRNPFLKIATDCGFPNVGAFNRAFRQVYGLTPTEYRKQFQAAAEASKAREEAPNPELNRKIEEFLDQKRQEYESGIAELRRLTIDCTKGQKLEHFWNRMINCGFARDILSARMQTHLLYMKRELGFSYIRFWDIWAKDMMLYDGNPARRYNFSRMDSVMDFLHGNALYPHIELGSTPALITRGPDNNIYYEQHSPPFQSAADFAHFVSEMLEHYIRRYDEEYVERWVLELWYDYKLKTVESYLNYFTAVYQAAKAVSPSIRVGGMGTIRKVYPSFEDFLTGWSLAKNHPDFISLYLYPYDNGFLRLDATPEESEAGPLPYSGDDYTRRFLDRARKAMDDHGFSHTPLYLSEWNYTFSNRDSLNDSAFKGAYLVKSLIDMMGKADLVGYWFASDLFSEYYDTPYLLTGSCGLVTKDGIPKPAFYAMQFFRKLCDHVLAVDGNSIVTTDQRGSFRIVCHNYCHPNELYYARLRTGDTQWEARDHSNFFEGTERKLEFIIRDVPNGTYYVKKRTVDALRGSVQDEWLRMGGEKALMNGDMNYLNRICVPHISLETVEAKEGRLTIQTSLLPHAIESLHIFPKR